MDSQARILTQIKMYFLMLPIMWLIGIEQIVLPFFFLFLLLQVIIRNKGKLLFSKQTILFVVFLGTQILSAIFAIRGQANVAWFVFLRNLAAFASLPLALLIFENLHLQSDQLRGMIAILVISAGIYSLIGLLGITGIWRPNFNAITASVVPEWILESSPGNRFFLCNIGHTAEFLGFTYFRVTSVFLYPAEYATLLLTSIPLCGYLLKTTKRPWSLVWLFIGSISLVNMFFTTARTAIISLLLGYFFYRISKLQSQKMFAYIVVVVFILAALISFFAMQNEFIEMIDTFLTFRSTGSRFATYRATIMSWLDRPWLGWGIATMQPETGVELALGSHSYYLAVLYRFGIIGFISFIASYVFLWKNTKPAKAITEITGDTETIHRFLLCFRWIFIAHIFDAVATIPIADISVMGYLACVYALGVVSRKMLTQNGQIYPV